MAASTDTGIPDDAGPGTAAEELPVRAGVVVSTLVVSAFVMILNETILSVALRDLTVDLGVETTTIQWLTSGFLLTMAVVIPTTGFLLERFTPRQVFLTSLTLFSAGTLVSALAPGFEVLLVGRVVQACGTAVMIPLLMTSVMRLVPPQRRGATMGTITIVIAVAPAIGPTIGGAVLATLGWRWMFWIVLPLAVIVLLVGATTMRFSSPTRSVPLDLLSVLLSAVGFGGLLYGLSAFGEAGGQGQAVPPWVWITAGAVALVLFVWRQLLLQREDRALLDLRPLTNRVYVIALVLVCLLFMCMLGAGIILLPLYMQTVLGENTFVTGLAVLPGGLVLGLLGRPVGALFDRVGARPLIVPGALAMAVSLWLFSTLGPGSPLGAVIGYHVLLMAGLGLMMTPLMTASLSAVPERFYSHGSAILATLQQVMGAFGTAIFVTVAALGSERAGATPDAAGLRLAFVVAGAIGTLGFVVSLFLRTPPTAGAASHGPDADAASTEPVAPAGPEVGFGAVVTTDDAAPSGDEVEATGAPGPDVEPITVSAPVLCGRVSTTGPVEAVVTLIDADGRQRGHTRTEDGRYRLTLPGPGSWQLVVGAPGHAPRAERVLVAAGAVEVAHDLGLDAAAPRNDGTTTEIPVLPASEPAAPRG